MSKSTISPADEIWALIRETQRNLKQFSAEAEKRQAEAEKRKAEIDRIINKLSTENTKINESLKKTNEGLKKAKELFETQWGKLMESLVEGDLVKVLNERGIDVEHTYMNIKREHGEDRYEYDIVAGNGDE
ncbi:MAG: hypothetical protein OXM55_04005, partial [Bdellovibrionales bacterium]|nr:hypothetical protein [Bdellovibrionales bacterium]